MPDLAPRLVTQTIYTVVMPCHTARDTIAQAIASVLAQTEPAFELIVVDDGSPDDSAAIAAAAIGADPRGRVIRQSNAGPAAARNHGAAQGSGTLLAFLDADDRWAPDFLRAHAEHFAANVQLGISFARTRFFDAGMTVHSRSSAHHDRLELHQVVAENPLCSTSNLVVRRGIFEALGGFDTTLFHAEDQEFVVRLLATTPWIVGGIDRELFDYRMSPSGLSADLARMEQGWRAMLDRARGYADPKGFAAIERRAQALFARYLARRALRTGQPAWRALGHFCTGLRIHPASFFAHETRRTLMTAAGIAAALLLPRRLVHSLIA